MRYRSKPSEIEAVQWTGDDYSLEVVRSFVPEKVRTVGEAPPAEPSRPRHHLELLAGQDGAQKWVPVPRGHWVVHPPGDLSDVWPVDPDYFAKKYEPVEPS